MQSQKVLWVVILSALLTTKKFERIAQEAMDIQLYRKIPKISLSMYKPLQI